ncbi:MAG TPA: PKD domain-containing protein [Bacteroidia bacterium]|nr:PKD domain-containing protein [Bacteroidia bacterium]
MKHFYKVVLHILFFSLFTGFYTERAAAQLNSLEGKKFFVSIVEPASIFGTTHMVTLYSKVNATVTLSNAAKGYNQTVNLTANVAQNVNVPIAASAPKIAEVVDNLSVEITSASNIQVQAFPTNGQNDGTMVYPENNLGTEYYFMTFEGSSGFGGGASSGIIVATQDNTQVEITPSVMTSGNKPAGIPFTVVLNKGQTYRLNALNLFDLTGTRVRVLNGCKPLVVYTGSGCSQVPVTCTNCGHLFEIMPHVSTWGKKFLLAPLEGGGFGNPTYTIKVLSNANGTQVYLNGTMVTLNKGQVHVESGISYTTDYTVTANNPILVSQFSEGWGCGGNSFPRMMLTPPVEQTVTKGFVVGPPAAFGNSTLQVVTKTAGRLNLKLNGSIIPLANFSTFGNSAEWSYANVSIGKGPHTITCDSGFIANIHQASTVGFGYMAASNTRILKYDISTASITCGSLTVTLFNSGDSDRIAQSKWLFDDNTSQTGKYITKTFAQQGTFAVTNIVSYQDDCLYTDTLITKVRTLPKPIVGFTVNDSVQCLKGNDFLFNDTTRYINGSKKLSSAFYFSDTSNIYKNGTSVTRHFSTPGVVKVGLSITTADLCTDSFNLNVKIDANAVPGFQVTSPQCFNSHLFKPVQQSVVMGSTITGYWWDFGDGTNGNQAVPSKSYSKDTTYEIILVAIPANGCTDTIKKHFTVLPSPKADFSVATSSVCLKDTIKVTNLSAFSAPLQNVWNMGDGYTSSALDLQRIYADTGVYTIKLKVTTPSGCPDSIIKPVVIKPTPKPGFTYTKRCTQSPSLFINQTFDFGQSLTTYTWKTGDSGQYASKNVVHTYKKEGAYQVWLYATLPNGCKDSTSRGIYINPKPDVKFTINDSLQCIRGNNFDFFNNTTLTEGKIKEFTWLLDDTLWSHSISVNKVFDNHGTFAVELLAVTDSLCSDSVSRQFIVAPQTAMDLLPSVDTQCYKNHVFNLINSSSIPSGTVTYTWKYSNGDQDNVVQPPPKTFPGSGIYQLTLLAVSDYGCRDSVMRNFTIYPSPALSFEVNDVCGSDSARFFNSSKVSSGRIVTWRWDLGDGDTSAIKHPIHKYPTFGYYNVSLIGITDLGCPDTIWIDSALNVKPAPSSYFTTELIEQRGNETIYDFTDLSSGAVNYFWNFDRGEVSRVQNPRFIFRDTGLYKVQLSVSNSDGCFSSYDTVIIVVPDIDIYIPNAFSPNKDINNPVFRIEGSYFYREFELQVFDRWGQRMFYSKDPETGWDGTHDGKMAPDGIYVYQIRIMGTDTKVRTYKGNLHLLR